MATNKDSIESMIEESTQSITSTKSVTSSLKGVGWKGKKKSETKKDSKKDKKQKQQQEEEEEEEEPMQCPLYSLSLAPTSNSQTEAILINITTYTPTSGVAGPLQAIPDDFALSLHKKLNLKMNFAILLNVTPVEQKCVYFYGDTFQQVIAVEIKSQANNGVLETDIEKIIQCGLNSLLANYCIFLKAQLKDIPPGSSVAHVSMMDIILPYPRGKKCIDSFLQIDVT